MLPVLKNRKPLTTQSRYMGRQLLVLFRGLSERPCDGQHRNVVMKFEISVKYVSKGQRMCDESYRQPLPRSRRFSKKICTSVEYLYFSLNVMIFQSVVASRWFFIRKAGNIWQYFTSFSDHMVPNHFIHAYILSGTLIHIHTSARAHIS